MADHPRPIGDHAARTSIESFYEIWLSQPISVSATALRHTRLAYIASTNPAERARPRGLGNLRPL